MISRYRNDNPRTADEIADSIETELKSINSSLPVVNGTQNYAYVNSFASTIASEQEVALNDLYDSGFLANATGDELTKKAREYGVLRQDAVVATGVAEFSKNSAASQDRVVQSGTRITTGGDSAVAFETTEQTIISSGTTTASANIRAIDAGPGGNVGANTIESFIDQPPGVENVTNPNPTGDTDYTLTDGSTPLRAGRDEEGDESLRKRALDTSAIGGAGTAEAVELALENIEDVITADVYTNRSASITNNVDPWHTEVRVYGASVGTISARLYEALPLITLKTLQGGANGTAESTTIDGGDLYGTLTIPITRPTQADLFIDISLVHTAEYGGTAEAKDAIVDYIGGTRSDGSTAVGLGQNQDVIVNEVENVVEDVSGVDAVTSSTIKESAGGSDATTTDADGVQVYAVGGSEVPLVDAANITITETAR